MKKLSLYVFLFLVWCNVGFAYTSTMCITSFGLSLADCERRIAECKKSWLSKKKCSEKISKDLTKERKEKIKETGKKILENMSEEEKAEIGKKLQELFEKEEKSRNVANALPKCEGDDYKQWTNCIGTKIVLPEDKKDHTGKYVGEFVDGKLNGQGKFIYTGNHKYIGDGAIYTGQWKNDIPHGQGTFTYSDDVIYVGEFKDGVWFGQGIATYPDGKVEKGCWEYNKLVVCPPEEPINGNPPKEKILAESSLPKCKGSNHEKWTNCQGTRIHEDGTKYVGEFKDGKRHGKGTMTLKDEDGGLLDELIVSAIWKNDLLIKRYPFLLPKCEGTDYHIWTNCQGTEIYDSGNKYIGQWFHGEYEYYGTFIWVNKGAKYVGQYNLGQKHGQGTMTYPDGGEYAGEWDYGKRQGQGTMTYPDGAQYVGEWYSDDKYGQGTFTWTNGEIQEGIWSAGDLEEGTKIATNGIKIVGQFQDGLAYGQGTMTYPDGTKYVGEFYEGLRNGQGTYTHTDGKVDKGIWENDKLIERQE